ncbi:hypothetical protein [Streptomyces sp. NPDC049590]|uniref:hypothetical protein n=1 Tax=Streptomyces sp. NPDC049590 TaxID=3154834 RepID=UPI00342F500C
MTAAARVRLARETGGLSGADGVRHVVSTPSVVLARPASARVVTAGAARLGHSLDHDQNRTALTRAKNRAFRTGRAVIDGDAFTDYLDGLTHATARSQP